MASPFKVCASDGIYTCSFCMLNGTVNCPDRAPKDETEKGADRG